MSLDYRAVQTARTNASDGAGRCDIARHHSFIMLLVGISSVAGICYIGWICVAAQDLTEGY